MNRAALRLFFILLIAASGLAGGPTVAAMPQAQIAMMAQPTLAVCGGCDHGAAKSADCPGACVLGCANLVEVASILIPPTTRAWSFGNKNATGVFLSPAPTPPRS